MKEEITTKKLRPFGLTVGGVFALIAFWPVVWRNGEPRWWIAAVAAFFLLPALIFPQSLLWVHKGWMAVGYVMGWINTRIILGAIFYVIVTPIGILRSWMGKDPMGRRLRPDLDTYRIVRKARPASHLTKQY
jgi:polyferredoxin